MTYTHRIGLIAALLFTISTFTANALAQQTRRPNVVIFLVDDLGPDELVCYATCFLGKWHLVPRPKPTEKDDPKRIAELAAMYQDYMPENNGFDENFGGDHSANQGGRFLTPVPWKKPNARSGSPASGDR